VVDQKGQLLNSKNSTGDANLSSRQFEYKKSIEEHLMERIANILTPLVGADGMRAQISADVDFTETDRTQEMFNPDLPALRSEQTSEEQNTSPTQGVPGALSNQPTPAGTAPETATAPAATATSAAASGAKSATRNFELDKTITHTRLATGLLRRLSVAVVVDDKHMPQADGTIKTLSYAQEDINRFSDLVKQAVGFDSSRGDQVTVSNVAFKLAELEALPELPLWEQGWFLDVIKQAVAVLAVLFLLFGVLRPTMRGLVGRDEAEKKAIEMAEGKAKAEAAAASAVRFNQDGTPVAVPAGEGLSGFDMPQAAEDLLLLDMPKSYEHRLEYVKRLIDDDPKIVAQVIKTWVKKDG
jgi:flagellar M-ring protein FliF